MKCLLILAALAAVCTVTSGRAVVYVEEEENENDVDADFEELDEENLTLLYNYLTKLINLMEMASQIDRNNSDELRNGRSSGPDWLREDYSNVRIYNDQYGSLIFI